MESVSDISFCTLILPCQILLLTNLSTLKDFQEKTVVMPQEKGSLTVSNLKFTVCLKLFFNNTKHNPFFCTIIWTPSWAL